MNPIRIPVTLSPHICDEKPRGFYVLAQRLFVRGAPILAKAQWMGFQDGLVITVDHPAECDTLLKMAIHFPSVTWLAPAKLWPMSKGFKSYIPGTILKPESAEACKIETTGIFTQYSGLFFLKIPLLDGEVLLGRKGIR